MNAISPCDQVCTLSCATPCTPPQPAVSLGEALARFSSEAVQGVCDTGRYRCRYSTWGEGPPLLILLGAADSSQVHVPLMALLSRSFRCIVCALPPGRDAAELVAEVWAVLDHVGAKQAYVFASSFGATVALAAMKAQPQRIPRAVLQAATACRPLTRTERVCAWLMSHLPGTMAALPLRRRLLHRLHHDPFAGQPPGLWEHFLTCTSAVPIRAVGRQARMGHHIDLRPMLPEIRQPILLVCGDRDPVIREEMTQQLLDGLPNAGRVVLEGSGHVPSLTHPEALAHVVRAFLTPPDPAGCPERMPLSTTFEVPSAGRECPHPEGACARIP